MTKVIYLIIASDNPEHQIDESAQKKTWANSERDNCIWLRGGSTNTFDCEKHQLIVQVKDDYEHILEKTIKGISWCLKNLDFEYLVRANVSSYFRVDLIRREFKKWHNNKSKFGGNFDFINDNTKTLRERMFINGGAIFLNQRACEELVDLNPEDFRGVPDDYAISHFLMRRDITPQHVRRGNLALTSIFSLRPYYRLKSSNLSSMASNRMYALHRLFRETTIINKFLAFVMLHLLELKYFKQVHGNVCNYVLGVYSILSNKIHMLVIRTK